MTERIAAATKETFRSLRVRNFRVFYAGQAVSQVGTWLQFIAQTLLVLQLTDSGTALGLLAAAQFLPMLVLGAWGGVVTDRLDKRRLLLVTQSSAMVVALSLGVLVLLDQVSLGLVYAAAFLTGLAMTFDNPARRVLVNELVEEEDVANAVSLNSMLMTGSRMIGPMLAGVLVATVGIGWCFVLNGVSYVAVLVALRRIDPAAMRTATRAERAKGQLREGLRYVWRTPELRTPLLLLGVVAMLGYNHFVLVPLLVDRDFHGSATTYAVLTAVMSLGAVIGSLWMARRREITTTLLAQAAVGLGLASAALAASPSVMTAAVTALLVGLTSIVVLAGTNAVLQLRALPIMRGRVLALFGVVFIGTTPVGGPMAGALADAFGARMSLAFGAAAAIAAGVVTLAALRRAAAAAGGEATGSSPAAPALEAA